MNIYLYYFNNIDINPFVFFIVKVFNDEDEKFLEDHSQYLFSTLIENKLANLDNILIFSIFKEHSKKLGNWILPSKNSNDKLVDKFHNDTNLINNLITYTLNKFNCETILNFTEEKLTVSDCNLNLSFLIEQYN